MTIYKNGQGNVARAVTALSGLGLGCWAAYSIGTNIPNLVVRIIVMILLGAAITGTGVYFALFHEKTVDLLIETQTEMRKVSWPAQKEFVGSTIVVIVSVLVLAVFIWTVDQLSVWILTLIGVY